MYSDDENQTPSGAELAYYLALIGMLGVVGFYCVELARLEYFGIDDWWLLHEVRQPGFSWTESFLPFEGRRHWAFRPIGEQAFYRIAYQAFGLEASGYFSFSILIACLTGWVAFGLARSLGMLRPSAWAVGVLAITALPTLSTMWNACLFTHILAQFCMALTLWVFIEGIRRNSSLWIAFSTIPFAIGLLSYEATLVLPAVMIAFSLVIDLKTPKSNVVQRSLLRVFPHALVATFYVLLRLALVRSQDTTVSMYSSNFDAVSIAIRIYVQILELTDGSGRLALLLAITGLVCVWIGRDLKGRRNLFERCLPIWLACALWIVLILIPMLAFSIFAVRFSIFIEVPAALAIGVLIDAALRRASAPQRKYTLITIGILVGLAIPWANLINRAHHEGDRFPRQIRSAVEAHNENIPERAQLILLYGTEGLSTDIDMDRFRRVSYGYTLMFWNFAPDKNLDIKTHDLRSAPTAEILCEKCIHMTIDDHLYGSFPDRQRLDTLLLKPGLESDDPDAWAAVFAKRFDLGETEIVTRAKSFCRKKGQDREAVNLCRKKIAGRLRSRNSQEARRLSRQIRPANRKPTGGRGKEATSLF
ncbi:MAG: hypothetical protein CBC48_04280 [bacterium TMED88]|nr:hypothetical protein [Deltaproteobacteria bacterium]OUV35279.1 MAG: hypothetical protein CBC48_04280 [bacterium TMED88]